VTAPSDVPPIDRAASRRAAESVFVWASPEGVAGVSAAQSARVPAVSRDGPEEAGSEPGPRSPEGQRSRAVEDRPSAARPDRDPGPVVLGYWTGRRSGVPAAELPLDLLSHVSFAFVPVLPTGEVAALSDDSARDVRELSSRRRDEPGLSVLVSVGGWGRGSAPFSDLVAEPRAIQTFAEGIADTYLDGLGFDGIDLDWEYPVRGGVPENPARPEDRTRFADFVERLREFLDRRAERLGRRLLLTAATPAGRYQDGGLYDPRESYDFARLAASLDWINLMAYDMGNGYCPVATPNAPLRSVAGDPTPEPARGENNIEAALRLYQDSGVPAGRIVLGCPLYGRVFPGVRPERGGLFSPYDGPVTTRDLREILSRAVRDHTERYEDPEAGIVWRHDPRTRTFLTYDPPETLARKGSYAREHGLRGVMVWEVGLDGPGSPGLAALAAGLRGLPPEGCSPGG